MQVLKWRGNAPLVCGNEPMVVVGNAGMASCLGRRVSKSSLRLKSASSSSREMSPANRDSESKDAINLPNYHIQTKQLITRILRSGNTGKPAKFLVHIEISQMQSQQCKSTIWCMALEVGFQRTGLCDGAGVSA